MDEVKFDPNGQPIRVQINMEGLVFITYRLFYFGAKVEEEKVLFEERGNNDQPHDDSFWLIDPSNPTEPVSNSIDRILLVEFTIFGLQPEESPFQISLDFFQNDTWIGRSSKISGKKKLTNTPKTEFIVVKFKALP